MHLSNSEWPLLEDLHLSKLDLKAAAFHHLSRGRWPRLQRLDIVLSQMTPPISEAIEALVQGQWPMLQSLHIGSSNLCYADGAADLIKGQWPLLQTLQVSLVC